MNMASCPPMEPFLARVKIRNYKSIGRCDVSLARMSVLIGRNGSGKSNFLDALRFVVDGLVTSLDHAIKARGGIQAVRRRSTGHPRNFAIELKLNLPGMQIANYAFEVAARTEGGFSVKREEYLNIGAIESVPSDPELARAGKGWIKKRIKSASYSETVDQPKLTSKMDFSLCRQRSKSFDKLCRELEVRLPQGRHPGTDTHGIL